MPNDGRDGSLDALFDPASLAVVGASDDPAKWGNWIALHALAGRHRRPVYLVNRRGGEVGGEAIYRSLRDLPEAPEMVVLAVPAAAFEEAVAEALAVGARMLVGITAGLGELGGAGKAREERIARRVRAAGARLLGPNGMGVYDAEAALYVAAAPAAPGPVGLISQSGNLAIELGILLEREGLGFSRLVSLGNQADVEADEVIEALAGHPGTRALVLYLEGFRDGRRFVAAARACRAAGTPVILIAPGRGAASRAARSHTGALAGDSAAVDAACRAAGAVRVASPRQAVELVQAMLAPVRPAGRRLGIVADGGGHGVIAADLAAAAGLAVPLLSDATAARLAAELPPAASTANPIDLAGGGERDFFTYARVVHLALRSGEVDSLLLTGFFGGYSRKSEAFARAEVAVAGRLADACVETGRALLVQTMHHDAEPADALRRRGVPVYAALDGAIDALDRAARWAEPSEPLLPVPPPAPPAAGEDYWAARELMRAAGLPFPRAGLVAAGDDVRSVAGGLRFPLVAKALGLLHKSDAGGVVLGIGDANALAAAVDGLRARLAATGIVVEEMAPVGRGVELIVGARSDAAFGPLVLVGLGGVYAEILGDVALALGPVDVAGARRLLRSLRGAAILAGTRGRPPVDVEAAAAFVAAFSALAAAHPEVAEMEVNPLLVLPDRVVALDARVVLARADSPAEATAGRG